MKIDEKPLQVFANRVRQAATQCPAAAETLKSSFPEVFVVEEGPVHVFNAKYNEVNRFNDLLLATTTDNEMLLQSRVCGKYKNISFWLSEKFDWELKRDDTGTLCLVPKRKKE